MAWIQLPSVTVANGSKLVTVPGGYDLANVEAGWSFDVGSYRAEIQSVSAQDANGVTTITLARNWDGSNVTAQPAQIVPIAGGELYVIQQLQDANDYAVQTHAVMRDYGSQDTDITLTPPSGDPLTIASMPKQDRLASEQRNANQQSFNAQLQQQQSDVNELLSNKTADGDDTTPGALLQVGATVKQLDTSNTNIRFTPSVMPLISCDLINNVCREFDPVQKSLINKSFAEIFNFSRSTAATGREFLGGLGVVPIDSPRFEYRDSKPFGVKIEGESRNLVKLFSSSNWAGSEMSDVSYLPSEFIDGDVRVEMTPSPANDYHFLYSGEYYAVEPNTEYVLSVWLDDSEDYNVRFIFRSSGTAPGNSPVYGPIGARFSSQVEREGTKRRYEYKFTTNSDCFDLQVRLYVYNDTNGTFVGDAGKKLTLEGVQLEKSEIATSNIIPGMSSMYRGSEAAISELPATLSEFTVLIDMQYKILRRTVYDYLLFLGSSSSTAGAGWFGVAFYGDTLRIRTEADQNLQMIDFLDSDDVRLKIGVSMNAAGELKTIVNGLEGSYQTSVDGLSFFKLMSAYSGASGSSVVRFVELYPKALPHDQMSKRLETGSNS